MDGASLLAEPNDTVFDAVFTDIGPGGNSRFVDDGVIGDNDWAVTDVDMLWLYLDSEQRVTIDIDAEGTGLDPVLCVFDDFGSLMAISYDDPAPGETTGTTDSYIDFTAIGSGTYYIGVSGGGNDSYMPDQMDSGFSPGLGETGGYQIEIVVRPTFTKITSFGHPTLGDYSINNNGTVSFVHYPSGYPNGVLFADDNVDTTWLDNGELHTGSFTWGYAFNDMGETVFCPDLGFFDPISYVVLKSPGAVGVPVVGPESMIHFASPDLNNSSTIVYTNLGGSPAHGVPAGVFKWSATTAVDVIASGEPWYWNAVINDFGTVAFQVYHDAGHEQIYLAQSGGTPKEIADTSGSRFDSFKGISINKDGSVAFLATLDSGGEEVVVYRDGAEITVADTDGPYAGFSPPSINDKGAVVFRASLDSGGAGIFFGPDPESDNLISTGEGLFGSLVTDVDFFGRYFYARRLNNAGQFVFDVELLDGTKALVRGTGVPEPEPTPEPAILWVNVVAHNGQPNTTSIVFQPELKGVADGDLSVEVGLFLSSDDTFDVNVDTQYGYPQQFDVIQTGGIATPLSFYLGKPLLLPANQPYLFVVADPFEMLPDSNRNDNLARLGFEPDYPGLVDEIAPATMANYDDESRSTDSIAQVVLHAMYGWTLGTTSRFQSPDIQGKPSAHYLISRNGNIRQMVREEDVAHHAVPSNSYSIGIELEDATGHRDSSSWATEPMKTELVKLVRAICTRHGIDLIHPAVLPLSLHPESQHGNRLPPPNEEFYLPYIDLGPFEVYGNYSPDMSLDPNNNVYTDGYGPQEPGILGHGQVLNRSADKDDPAIWDWLEFMCRLNGCIQVQLNSPANLLITDPSGRRSGVDPATGATLLEIPGTRFSGPGTHPQTLAIPFPDGGNYTVEVVGIDSGTYDLKMLVSALDAGLTTAEFSGTTHPGLVTTYAIQYSSEDSEAAVFTQVQDALVVNDVVINDGSAQRSMVTSLTVTFSDLVTLDPGAFALVSQGGKSVGLNIAQNDSSGQSVVTLSFAGPDIIGGSLADANYRLTIHGDKVHDSVFGQDLDGDGDGSAGGDYVFGDQATDALFRLFGDSDGDRDVDNLDFLWLRSTYCKSLGDLGFLWYFDHDGDHDVDVADYQQFRTRLRTVLNPWL
ncbi:MAG TPA: N-acetylmuramoyl-L-alanine amidase [Thermoguttaceae bacterium]|nr:N-acetylmuramoyl-L-alanine amidase [Thermoguttaceae bacterium]